MYNKEYLNLINQAIEDEKIKYAIPVYTFDFIKDNDNIQLTIDHDTFLEMILLRIRGETIKFSSFEKKMRNEKEKNLIDDIKHLEKNNDNFTLNGDLLEDKKLELEKLRKEKIKGQMIRAQLQWLNDGEKSSNFFCKLENKHYVEKTMKKLQMPNGDNITNQQDILTKISEFYANLFQNKDQELNKENIEQFLSNKNYQRIHRSDLGHPLTVKEIGNVLKKMKNGKSPGIDGITAEFLKVFWRKLKVKVTNAINCCFEKGQLSTPLRQSIITCIPKGNKDRKFIKNWRPISLLCVTYKLASAAMAERIKPFLEKIISRNQTGFITGRYIGESTRLIYDLMHHTRANKIPGLLMTIDFEKAFDSVSWSFLYKTLEFFGFDQDLIRWIKLFNNNIFGYILQCGFLSKPFPIRRGCRQGDPISSYLFLLGAEILNILIKNETNIKGITIGGISFKITQFADDTTLILDGSRCSLQAALNVLEIFGSFSGLRMNSDKTKVIWIGCKKHSKDKLDVTARLEWLVSNFTLLGMEFSTDLEKIPEMNYDKIVIQASKILKSWQHRILTPIGKIAVIKTLILSKFNHLFISVPVSDKFLKKINDLIYGYLWEGKPDKISRKTICANYFDGGLKMVNIFNFEKSLKLSWVKRMAKQDKADWYKLLQISIKKLKNIFVLGGEFCTTFIQNVNPFWKIVFQYWKLYCHTPKASCNQALLSSVLWYNSQISKTNLFYPDWFNSGIHTIADVVDSDGVIYDYKNLKLNYNLNINILNYYTVKGLVKKFIDRYRRGDDFRIYRIYHFISTFFLMLVKKAVVENSI